MKRLCGAALFLLMGVILSMRSLADGEGKGVFEKYTLHQRLGIGSLAPSPNGKQAVLAMSDFTLRTWDIEKGQELKSWKAHEHPAIHRVLYSPDGKQVFSCAEDGTIRQWDSVTGKEVREFKGHLGGVKSIELSTDAKQLLTGGADGHLRLFDVASGQLIHGMRIFDGTIESPFHCTAISPKGDLGLGGNAKGYISLWDLKTGKLIKHFAGNKTAILAIAFLSDGKSFVTGDSGAIRVWDSATGKVTTVLQGHDGEVTTVAVSADGTKLVSGGADKSVRLWDLKTGKELVSHTEHSKTVTRALFVGKDKVLSSSEDGTMIVWQPAK